MCKFCHNIELLHRVCDTTNNKCIYGECPKCKMKPRDLSITKSISEEVNWQQWVREKTEINNPKKQRYKKGTSSFCQYLKHIYNCRRQYRYFKERRENLGPNECLIHMDFSENYNCKLANEVQSMHFGASKKQISLQTGVYYIGKEKGQIFSTVTDCMQHGPAAIWCHLNQVLCKLKTSHKDLDTIESFKPVKFGFEYIIRWSFFEAGHGKGIPDAVGGSLKRKADRRVKYGHDIANADDFVENLKSCKTRLWLVDQNKIEKEKSILDEVKLKLISGTLKLHQILVNKQSKESEVYYRNSSCSCSQQCEHFETNVVQLIECKFNKTVPTANNKKTTENDSSNKQTESRKRRQQEQENIVPEKRQKRQIDDKQMKPYDRKKEFKTYLQKLAKCRTFCELQTECKQIDDKIGELTIDPHEVRILKEGIEVVINAADYIPSDILDNRLLPGVVHSDGNCLPSTGSVFADSDTEHVEEMRVRIIIEQVKHELFT
ncbi:hypothetical protein MAR_027279 [Mya arenaria]|uniref:Uncharacterized protein n=1 Tax=Mya arenaria TaxID=6604 RepID=A0ABY7EXE6_MYAAR|nr:hypothetical protein MAR_027279 [Mya arenaria]